MVDRKVAGLKNKVNGAFFEDIINQACDFYRVRGVADIEKTPEPVRLIKPIKGKPGYFVAVHNEAAQVDYKGFLRGGQAIVKLAGLIGSISQRRGKQENE